MSRVAVVAADVMPSEAVPEVAITGPAHAPTAAAALQAWGLAEAEGAEEAAVDGGRTRKEQ